MMKLRLVSLLLLACLILGMTACGGGAQTEPEMDQSVFKTATAEARLLTIPEDVPIMEGAENLKVAANDTYIAYEVEGTLDDVVLYYRDQVEKSGWEKRGSSPENPIGGAQTLLRYKEDRNISVTIQSIPESTKVRILMTIIPKN
jgi:hypothetical protein